jgi:hypothetical protein
MNVPNIYQKATMGFLIHLAVQVKCYYLPGKEPSVYSGVFVVLVVL